jgi:hypothetical protein
MRQQDRHVGSVLFDGREYLDTYVVRLREHGSNGPRLLFVPVQPVQEAQKVIRERMRGVVFSPELTADHFAKRAMRSGPFGHLNGRQGHSTLSKRARTRF